MGVLDGLSDRLLLRCTSRAWPVQRSCLTNCTSGGRRFGPYARARWITFLAGQALLCSFPQILHSFVTRAAFRCA